MRLRLRDSCRVAIAILGFAVPLRADTPLNLYEADVFPYADGTGWVINNTCNGDCFEYLEAGNYVTEFIQGNGSHVYYHHWITQPPDVLPASLYVEARMRTNSTYDGVFFTYDGRITVLYGGASDSIYILGDLVSSAGGDFAVLGLSSEDFRVYRFEGFEGHDWTWTVDGLSFYDGSTSFDGTYSYVQFGSQGGNFNGFPGLKNEWDYVRLGTILFGEVVVAADPPDGYIDPRQDRPPFQPQNLQGIKSFTVTFDQPNGLYLEQITVESTAPASLRPSVKWVTRPEGESGGATSLVILDKRIPPGHRTRFTISDEVQAAQHDQIGATSVVEYAFLPGDVNQDESVSSLDVLTLVVALNNPRAVNPLLHDINRDSLVAATDMLRLVQLLNGVQTAQAWLGYTLPAWP